MLEKNLPPPPPPPLLLPLCDNCTVTMFCFRQRSNNRAVSQMLGSNGKPHKLSLFSSPCQPCLQSLLCRNINANAFCHMTTMINTTTIMILQECWAATYQNAVHSPNLQFLCFHRSKFNQRSKQTGPTSCTYLNFIDSCICC